MDVLEEVSRCNVSIVYVVVDKYDYSGKYYGIHGNDLYEAVLSDLLSEAFSIVNKGDANVFLDRSSFVTLGSFRAIAKEIAIAKSRNLKKCDKVTSHQNACRSPTMCPGRSTAISRMMILTIWMQSERRYPLPVRIDGHPWQPNLRVLSGYERLGLKLFKQLF